MVIAYVVRLRSSSFSRHLPPSSFPRSPPAYYILSYLAIPVPALSTAEASLLNMRRRPIVAGPSDSLADLCTYLEARFLNRVWVPRNFSYTRSYLSLPHSLFDPPFEPPHSSLCSVSLDINRKGRTRPYLGLECLAHFLTHKLSRRAPLSLISLSRYAQYRGRSQPIDLSLKVPRLRYARPNGCCRSQFVVGSSHPLRGAPKEPSLPTLTPVSYLSASIPHLNRAFLSRLYWIPLLRL